jgi:hypothetical protein
MSAKKKRIDAAKQREKRTKIAAIVGVVLLVAVGAYEIPSMLALMNKKPPPGTTYDPGPSSSLPNVSGGASGASGASSGELVNTDVPPSSEAGQLVSFSVFETKNPFTPQVSSSEASQTPGGSTGADVPASTTPTSTVPAGTVVPPTGTTPVTTTPAPPTTTTTTTTPVQATVDISVNGAVSHVGRDGTFPAGTPVFRLVSWTKDVAQIGIVGGSYATGDATLTLRVGRPVTLENQTDGKRYRIELLSTP